MTQQDSSSRSGVSGVSHQELIVRIDAAIDRIVNGSACMRIPAEPEDPDLVLADCKRVLKGLATQSEATAGQWQPIATAPLDKTSVFLARFTDTYIKVGAGRYMPMDGWQGWYGPADYHLPTHWMPLPPEPTPATKDGEKA